MESIQDGRRALTALGSAGLSALTAAHLLVLEALAVVLLEGLSWYLAILSIFIVHFHTVSTEAKVMLMEAVAAVATEGATREGGEQEQGQLHQHEFVEKKERKEESLEETNKGKSGEEETTQTRVFPGANSVTWVNCAVARVWRRCVAPLVSARLATDFLRRLAEEVDQEEPAVAAALRQLTVERLGLGDSPLVVGGVEAEVVDGVLDLRVSLACRSAGAQAAVGWARPELWAAVRRLGLLVEVGVAVGPLPRDLSLPTIRLSLLSQPRLLLEGGGLLAAPLALARSLATCLSRPLLSWLVVRPRAALLRPHATGAQRPVRPAGLLRVVVEARRLLAADTSFLQALGASRLGQASLPASLRATSDPYCQVEVRGSRAASQVMRDTCSPVWNFHCCFPLLAAAAEVVVRVWDWDRGAAQDDFLGESSAGVAGLAAGQVVEQWLDLATATVSTGQVRLRVQWLPCLPLERRPSTSTTELPCRQAILVVLVRRVVTSDVVEPLVSLQVAGGDHLTTSRGDFTCHTDFEEHLLMAVAEPVSDTLTVTVHDLASPRQVGQVGGVTRCLRRLGQAVKAKEEQPRGGLSPAGVEEWEGCPGRHFHPVGELSVPVRRLLHLQQVVLEEVLLERRPDSVGVEGRITMTLRLHPLAPAGTDPAL